MSPCQTCLLAWIVFLVDLKVFLEQDAICKPFCWRLLYVGFICAKGDLWKCPSLQAWVVQSLQLLGFRACPKHLVQQAESSATVPSLRVHPLFMLFSITAVLRQGPGRIVSVVRHPHLNTGSGILGGQTSASLWELSSVLFLLEGHWQPRFVCSDALAPGPSLPVTSWLCLTGTLDQAGFFLPWPLICVLHTIYSHLAHFSVVNFHI